MLLHYGNFLTLCIICWPTISRSERTEPSNCTWSPSSANIFHSREEPSYFIRTNVFSIDFGTGWMCQAISGFLGTTAVGYHWDAVTKGAVASPIPLLPFHWSLTGFWRGCPCKATTLFWPLQPALLTCKRGEFIILSVQPLLGGATKGMGHSWVPRVLAVPRSWR